MLIDEVQITIKAGNGGDGLAHFYSDQWRPKGGPDGGDGGKGGSVFFKAVPDISKLSQFRYPKVFQAENGSPGGKNQRTGKNGNDLVLEVPVGTIVYYDNGTSLELDHIGQIETIAKGGKGGRGNYSFRSSTNQTPKEFQPGFKTTPKKLRLELKLIADVGLIGLPNTGKTSLLNELSNANAKVANYPFTTLEPNLGVSKGNLIIADIPGLIEGASDGKGLGQKFLRHVERTRLLVHCLAADANDHQNDYNTVRQEINFFSSKLMKKKEIIIVTKSDTVDQKTINSIVKKTKAKMAVSILDDQSIKMLSDLIHQSLK